MTILEDIKATEKALELNIVKLNNAYEQLAILDRQIKNLGFNLQHFPKEYNKTCQRLAEVLAQRQELLEEIALLNKDNEIMQADLADMQ